MRPTYAAQIGKGPKVTHAALLAPVPEEHLVDGVEVATRHGHVAYGSRAWEVFRELDRLREGAPIPVYIYASWASTPVGNKVTWQGLYTGHVESRAGSYPGDVRHRPPSTQQYTEDVSGYWAVFWHVRELRHLPRDEWIDVADIRNFKTQKRYGRSFTPEGPIIVGHP